MDNRRNEEEFLRSGHEERMPGNTEGSLQSRRGERRLWCMVIAAMAVTLFSGCAVHTRDQTKVRELDYTVVEPDEIPGHLAEQIELEKKSPFHFTYEDGEYLYLVAGYGEQATGGYSIQVKECYLSTDTIYIDTELIGPRKGETIQESASYPTIVIKLELREENVIFQ